MRPRPRLALALVATTLICGAWAPSPSGVAFHREDVEQMFPEPASIDYEGTTGHRVVFIGDSLGRLVEVALPRRFVPRYRLHHFSRPTSGLHDLRGLMARQAATRPDVFIAELGSADISSHRIEDITAWLNDAMDILTDVPCVIWPTVKEHGVDAWYNRHWQPEAAELNAAIRYQAAVRPGVHVYDWADISLHHPAWLLEDYLHPNWQGADRYAQGLRAMADQCMATRFAVPFQSG